MLGTNFFKSNNPTVNVALSDEIGNAILVKSTAANIPSAVAGYAVGCELIATDTGNHYFNTGTAASATFTLVDTASTSLQLPEAATDASTTTGTSLNLTMNAVTTGVGQLITANGLTTGNALRVASTTSAVANVEPIALVTTLTGAGATGGRFKSTLNANAALGSWSNALKGEVTYNASGSTSGLGSAIVAEMTLSAGTSAGTYAPLELELNLGTGALTGTATSLIYGSVNGDDAGTFDTNGFIMTIAGLTAGASNAFRTGLTAATINAATTAALRINIGGTTYYIPIATATV